MTIFNYSIVRKLILTLPFVLFIFILLPHSAKAAVACSSNVGVPCSVQLFAEQTCSQPATNGTGQAQTRYVAQESWLSAVGNPDQQTIDDNTGQSTVQAQWNYAIYYCQGAGVDPYYTQATNFNPLSATTSDGEPISGLNTTVLLAYNTNAQWSTNSESFTIGAPSHSTTITVSGNWQAINQFGNAPDSTPPAGGTYECVGSPLGPPWSISDGYQRLNINDFGSSGAYPACLSQQDSLNITIDVNNTVIGHVDTGVCQPPNITGWAFDKSASSASINVSVYEVGSGGALPGGGPGGTGSYVGEYPTNVYRSGVNSTYGITGNHGFQITLPSGDLGNQENTFYVYGIGVSGETVYIGQESIGPCSSAAPTSNPCPVPSSVGLNSSNEVNVNLPNNQPPGTSSSSPPATTTSPGAYTQATPYSYSIISAYDQYSNPTNITWSPNNPQSSNTFTMNYTNYIDQYPYDDHSTTINYNETFNETYYNTQFDYYSCGGAYNGSNTCTDSFPATPDTYCQTALVYDPSTNSFTCPGGYTTTYSCPYGNLNGTTCSYSYPATPVYDYYQTGTGTATTNANFYGAPELPEICPRAFSIQPPNLTDVTQVTLSGGTADNPNQATVQTVTTVNFSLPDGDHPLRHPMSVNGINFTGYYYIAKASQYGLTPITPPTPDNETFNIGSTYQDNTNVPYSYSKTFSVSMPPLEVGDEICAEFTETPQQGAIDEGGNIEGSAQDNESSVPDDSPAVESGTYSGTQYSSPIPNPPTYSDCSGPVENDPYARFYGNDVASGIQFAGSNIACDTNAGIVGTQDGGTGIPAIGSGSQFAAMSLGQISNFASAFLRNVNPTSANGLTLSNDSSGGNGNFNNSACPTVFNYYAERPTTIRPITTNSYNLNSGANDTVQINSSGSYVTLQGNNIEHSHVVYINGNVYIPKNINYGSNGQFNASTGKLINVPSLYVVVLGNIYIGPNVTNLDGVYVAENSGDINGSGVAGSVSYNPAQGGLINTCSDINNLGNVSAHFSQSSLFASCDNQLTITGALIAHQIKLERTHASIRNSQAGENPLGGSSHDCTFGNGSSMPQPSEPDCSAEIFNFNPENYLGNPNFDSSQRDSYDSILSLPPVL